VSKVGVVFKVFAEEGKLDSVMEAIKGMKPQDLRKEELAFGISVAKVLFVFDDSETGSSKIEEKLKGINGVSEVDVEEETLV
jgi:translation elongation factor EF-1beta